MEGKRHMHSCQHDPLSTGMVRCQHDVHVHVTLGGRYSKLLFIS